MLTALHIQHDQHLRRTIAEKIRLHALLSAQAMTSALCGPIWRLYWACQRSTARPPDYVAGICAGALCAGFVLKEDVPE
jgi:hypothetical protein